MVLGDNVPVNSCRFCPEHKCPGAALGASLFFSLQTHPLPGRCPPLSMLGKSLDLKDCGWSFGNKSEESPHSEAEALQGPRVHPPVQTATGKEVTICPLMKTVSSIHKKTGDFV